MNKDQTAGIFERMVYGVSMGALAKLVAKGYINQDMAAYVASGVVGGIGSVWAWWINRPKALAQSAAAQGYTVVTDAKTAHDTPEPNIVSNATMKVVPR